MERRFGKRLLADMQVIERFGSVGAFFQAIKIGCALKKGRFGSRYDTAYWGFLRVGTTLDIFQNIQILYLGYGVLSLSGYGVLRFIPEWSLERGFGKRLLADMQFCRNRNTGDDDNFLFIMPGSLRSVPWLGSHTESVIATMTGD
ncbi:hypothetical protein Tco_0813606 [Tanacetum coccineum]